MSQTNITPDTEVQAPPIIVRLPGPQIPDCGLAARADGIVIFAGTRRLGATIRQCNGLWGAWSTTGKIGEYETPVAAECAVCEEARRAAYANAKRGRRR